MSESSLNNYILLSWLFKYIIGASTSVFGIRRDWFTASERKGEAMCASPEVVPDAPNYQPKEYATSNKE